MIEQNASSYDGKESKKRAAYNWEIMPAFFISNWLLIFLPGYKVTLNAYKGPKLDRFQFPDIVQKLHGEVNTTDGWILTFFSLQQVELKYKVLLEKRDSTFHELNWETKSFSATASISVSITILRKLFRPWINKGSVLFLGETLWKIRCQKTLSILNFDSCGKR